LQQYWENLEKGEISKEGEKGGTSGGGLCSSSSVSSTYTPQQPSNLPQLVKETDRQIGGELKLPLSIRRTMF
jgi:hypothetical protein